MTAEDYVPLVLSRHPERCDVRDVRTLAMPEDCRRGSGGKPARLALAVADTVVKALNGTWKKARHDVFLVVIPRTAMEEPAVIQPGDKRWPMPK